MSARVSGTVSIEALPDVYGETAPGFYVIATENGTRYLILIHPDGPNRAMRVSWYGERHAVWRPFAGAWAYSGERWPAEPVPARVGEMMMVQFSCAPDDYYRSGIVTEILSHALRDALRLEEVEGAARAAMLDTAVALVVEASTAGRIRDTAHLVAVCTETGIDLDEVRRRLP
jgi:hypothetical protein